MRVRHIIAAGLALLPAAAFAGETVTYTYDAKGRLTQVAHSGSINNGQTSTYAFDAADNRVSYAVAGASSQPGGSSTPPSSAQPRLVVVPLNGLTPIIIH